VEDHHVDRPEVEAGQPAQLTGTNRSIGLIPALLQKRRGGTRCNIVAPRRQAQPSCAKSSVPPNIIAALSAKTLSLNLAPTQRPRPKTLPPHITPIHPNSPPGAHISGPSSAGRLAGLVAMARGQTPDPIPNSAVKTLCADGTAPQGAEE
jgi:hypothetical protein